MMVDNNGFILEIDQIHCGDDKYIHIRLEMEKRMNMMMKVMMFFGPNGVGFVYVLSQEYIG